MQPSQQIDQHARLALVRRIARYDRTAIAPLAELYAAAGYPTLARSIADVLDDDNAFHTFARSQKQVARDIAEALGVKLEE